MVFSLKDLITKSGSAFKNVLSKINHECTCKNIKLSSEIISYSVLLFFLDPKQGISDCSTMNQFDIDNFIKNSLTRLSDTSSMYMKSLKLQLIFLNTSLNFKEVDPTNLYSSALAIKADNLMKEIIEFNATNKDEHDKLFRKIVFDLIIYNKLGKPANSKVITETSNALKSIMTREELHDFSKMKRNKRLDTLNTLRKIVCGIMIFNNDDGQCGEEMRDIIKDVSLAYKKTHSTISQGYSQVKFLLNNCNKIFDSLININVDTNELTFKYDNLSDIQKLKQFTQLCAQHEYYLKVLLLSIDKIRYNIDSLFESWRITLQKLHQIVQYRISVPTEVVFPFFIELSVIWHTLWNYLYLMVDLSKLNDKMIEIVFVENQSEIISKFENISYNNDDAQQNSHNLNKFFGNNTDECEWIVDLQEIQNNFSPVYQYCTYLLIIGNGVLIPSNLNLGLLRYRKKLYAFSDIKYAKIFANNPKLFEHEFMKTIRINSHLIIFFDMYDAIKNYQFFQRITKDIDDDELSVKTKSVEIQTELHPIPYYKDKDYKWNVWDLRRQVIKMNHLKKCTNSSAQTDISGNMKTLKLNNTQ